MILISSMEKDFENWHKLKFVLDTRTNSPIFQEREIWWCSLGVNIGDEENGKGDKFNRPILIIRKFNKRIFWGLPLTTQVKDKPHYYKIHFKDKTQCVMVTQFKLLDSKRLTHRMGQLSREQFEGIRSVLKELI